MKIGPQLVTRWFLHGHQTYDILQGKLDRPKPPFRCTISWAYPKLPLTNILRPALELPTLEKPPTSTPFKGPLNTLLH